MKLIKIISIIVFVVPFWSKAQTLSGEFTNVCVDQEYTYTVGLGAYCVTVNDLNCVGCYDVTISVDKRSITLKWSPGNIGRSVSGTVMCFEPDSQAQAPVQTPIGGNVSLAAGENPFFICEGEIVTTKTAFDKPIPESDSRCSDTNIRINLSRDSDYPDFLNKGYPFDRSKTTDRTGIKVEKVSTGLGTRAMITLYWKAGWSGDIKVSVEYEKRKWDITDIFGKCETDPWKELVSYTYYRGGNPAGTLSGPSTVVFSGTGVNIDQSYVTSFHGVVPAIKYSINGTEVSEKTSCSGNTSIMGLSYRTTEPGTFNITTQVQDECGRWTDGPTKTVNVYASCYQDNAANVSSTITGNGLVSYPEGYMIVPDELYSISVSGITDFSNNYEIDFGDGRNDMNIVHNTFSVFKKIGKYDVNIVKKPGREICPSVPSIVVFLNGKDETFDKDCAFVLPDDFDQFGFPNIDYGNIVLEHFAGIVKSKRSITVMPGVTLAKGAEIILLVDPPQPQPDDPDLKLNFVQKTTYDGYNRISGQSRSYITDDGKGTQVQLRNIEGGTILASQTIYDAYDRAAVQTLPAPVNSIKVEENGCQEDPVVKEDISFQFAPLFVTDQNGDAYDYRKFDRTSGEVKAQNPDPVHDATPGTLGWYYSTNNGTVTGDSQGMNEPLVAATKYPYSRTLFNEDGSGELTSVTAPGDKLRAGLQHYGAIHNKPVDESDQTLNNYLKFRLKEFGLGMPSQVKGNYYRTEATDANGNRSVSYIDKFGSSIVSQYFAQQNVPLTTAYKVYDNATRLIASISPNGVDQYNGSNYEVIDKSVYTYDYRGLLTESKETDAGTTKFIYRRDGRLRFVQNSEQESGYFSYINYDFAGRPVESGEYTSGSILFNSEEMRLIVESISAGGGLSGGSVKDRILTYYDFPAEQIAQMGGPSMPDLLKEGRIQRFGAGAVTCTQKEGVITSWYSYDELGRVEWMIQDIVGLGLKTLDYRYGATGNVEQVTYQTGKPDQFIHYYEYDQNARLYKAYTTRKALKFEKTGKLSNPDVLLLQATYLYYLHGPLKRIVYADGVQGIDYTYTANGMVKSINDGIKTNDPGGDTNDAFGIVLDYYPDDYISNKFNPGTLNYPSALSDQFNGNVKASRWHSPIENHQTFAYTYRYDERYQLQEAQWGSLQGTDIIFDPKKPYREYVGSYDANGNINSLNRSNEIGDEIAKFKYNYTPNSNRLFSISQQNSPTDLLRKYRYDLRGQMVEQEDAVAGTKFKPEYDRSGKITAIRNENDRLVISMTYNDVGFRLSKKTYDENGDILQTTWYVRDAKGNVVATYLEQPDPATPIELIEVPVYGKGKIGVYKPGYGTFYEVTDHLGNVRAVVAGEFQTTTLATMENGRAGRESKDFFGMRTTATSKDINHTPDIVTIDGQNEHLEANKVVRLNNRPNGQYHPNPIGGGTMLWVHPGDTVKAEVFVKYSRNERKRNRKELMAFANLVKNLSPAASAVELKKVFQILNKNEFRGLPVWGKLDEAEPPSFLNGLLFDKDMKFQSFDFDQVSLEARIDPKNPKGPHEKLQLEFVIEKEGYLYIYISNESKEDVDIYFDDLRVIHSYGDIVAGGDYYPFGLEIKDRQITLEDYRFGYQGQYSEKDKETGWNHFELRDYDPIIGRWTSIDPEKQFPSPYVGMGNNPVTVVDPRGGTCFDANGKPITCPDGFGDYSVKGNDMSFLPEVIVTPSIDPWSYTHSGFNNGFDQRAGAINMSVNFLQASAYNQTGNGDYKTRMAVSIGAEGSVLNGSLDIRGGSRALGIVAGGKGSVLSAKGNLDVGWFNGERGKRGLLIDGNLGAYVAEGEYYGGVTLGGVTVKVIAGGSFASAHIGGTVGAHYDETSGEFIIEGFEHFGAGIGEKAGVKIIIPVRAYLEGKIGL